VLVNLSGRGDKDMGTAIEWFGLGRTEAEVSDDVTEEPVG
jgi:tryptophan synthase beta chain